MKNEPEARADPGSEPSKRSWNPILKKPEGTLGNTPIEILGRSFEILGSFRIKRLGAIPFFSFYLVPQVQESPPPGFHRGVSSRVSKGLLSGESVSLETRDSSRELASNQVHLPSQSQISHELHQVPAVLDRRSNRDILLSVERDSKEKVFLAGSREPTPAEREDWETFREEVEDLKVYLAQDPNFLFGETPRVFGLLSGIYQRPDLFSLVSRTLFPAGTDTPEPGENTTLSDPNLVQGGPSKEPPESPSPGTTGETEGERR